MLDIVLAGLSTGCIYALIAVGFNIVFKSTDALNFAQGDWVMLGGMVAAFAYGHLPIVWLACLLGALATAIAGGLSERLAIRPFRLASPFSITLVSIGLSLVTRSLVMLTLGKEPEGYPGLSGSSMAALFVTQISSQMLWIFGITLALMLLTHLFFEKTRYGIAMRAAAADRQAAALMGINPNGVVAASFVLAALFGGIAGAIITPLTLISYDSGSALGFKGFAAAMLGGVGNLYGAVVGGLLIGLIESLTAGYVSPEFKDCAPFIILLAVLLMRPQGLLGRTQAVKV